MLPYHSNTSNLTTTTSSAPSSSNNNMKQNNRKKDLIKQELDVDQLLQPSPSKSFAIFDLNSPITSLSRSITLETSPSAAGTPMNMDPHRFHESSPLQHSPSTTLAPYISDFSHHQSHHHSTSSSGGLAFHSSTPLSSPSTAPPIRYVSATTGGSLSTPNNSHTPTMSGNTGNITKNSLQFPLTSSSELPMPFGLSTPTSFNNLTTPTLGSGLFSSSSPSGAPPFSSNTPQSSNNNSSNNGILNTLNSSIPNQSINSNNHHENITQLPPIHPPSESIVNQQQHHQPHNLHIQQHQQQHPQIVQQHQQPHIIHQPNNLTQPTQSGTVYKSPQPSSSQNNQFKPLNSPTSSYHSDEEAKPKDRIVVIPDTGSATGTISIDTEGLMIIEEGFDLPPPNPQPGGKQNKKPLPRHIISVNVSAIPRYQFYSIKVSLLGYKTKQKEVLKDILDPVLLSKSKPNMRGDAQRVDMHFDTITIDEASHMNGRKFFLRFSLLSPDKLPVTHVDSSYFETITDRGNQKRQQKIDHSRSKISKVLRVSPRYSIVQGGQLVKVLLNQQIVAPSNVYVYFGDKRARCIYVSPHKDNTIVCETPDGNADEEVEVKVSLDKGKTFMATDASLRYIPMGNLSIPNDHQGRMSPLSMPFMVNQNEMRLKKNFPAPPISNDDEYYDESPEQEQYDDYETVQSNNPLNFVNNSNMSNSQQQQPIVINSQMNNQQMSSRQFGLANNALVNSINNMNNMNNLGNMGLNNNAVNLNNMNNNMNNMNNMNMNGNNGMNNMNNMNNNMNNMNNMNSMNVNMNNMNNNMNMNNMNGNNNLPLNIASMGINPNTMNNLNNTINNNNNNNGFNQQMFNQSHLQNQFHNYHNK